MSIDVDQQTEALLRKKRRLRPFVIMAMLFIVSSIAGDAAELWSRDGVLGKLYPTIINDTIEVNGTSRNSTFIDLRATNIFTTNAFIGGKKVCLADGTNCPLTNGSSIVFNSSYFYNTSSNIWNIQTATVFVPGIIDPVDFTTFSGKAATDITTCAALETSTMYGVVQNTTTSYNQCVLVPKTSGVGGNGTVTSVYGGDGLNQINITGTGTLSVNFSRFTNSILSSCSNITGATSNLCTIIDTVDGNFNATMNATIYSNNVTVTNWANINFTEMVNNNKTIATGKLDSGQNKSKVSLFNVTGLIKSFQCSASQFLSNVTINETGLFGVCGTVTATVTENSTKVSILNVTNLKSSSQITNGITMNVTINESGIYITKTEPSINFYSTCDMIQSANPISPTTFSGVQLGNTTGYCYDFSPPINVNVRNVSIRTLATNSNVSIALYNSTDRNRILYFENTSTQVGWTHNATSTPIVLQVGLNYTFCVANGKAGATATYATLGNVASGGSVGGSLPFYNITIIQGRLPAILNVSAQRIPSSSSLICGYVGTW